MVEYDRSGPLDLLTWAFSRIAIWAPAFIVSIILYEVIMRYFFAAATLWVNEMSLWIGGCIYLTSGLYSMQQRSHIRIFILYDIAPLWLRRVFDILANLCLIVFCSGVIFGSFDKALFSFSSWELFGSAFNPPIPATMKPLILILMLFLSLQALSNLIRDWPAHHWVRKGFDILVTGAIVALALWGLHFLFIGHGEQFGVPTVWLYSIAFFLLASIAIVIFGLIKDFNKTPNPFSAEETTK